jgi:hypothetical protein
LSITSPSPVAPSIWWTGTETLTWCSWSRAGHSSVNV